MVDQGDRHVPRYAVAPQPGLPFAVLLDAFSGRAQERVGEQEVTGDLLEAASLVRLDAKQPQLGWAEAQAKSIARSMAWGSPYLSIRSRTLSRDSPAARTRETWALSPGPRLML